MARTLVTEGNRKCPACGESKQRLSRHWSYCEWPSISDETQRFLTGILLGGGTIQGNGEAKHLLASTTRKPLAQWLFDELGWLAHSLRRETYEGERQPRYLVRTHAHEALGRERNRWYDEAGSKQIPDDVALNTLGVRAWYAQAGGIEWSGPYNSQFRVIFSAEANRRADAIQSVLDQYGYDSNRLDKRVAMYGDTARRFLSATEPPVPGVEHKWQVDKVVYSAIRTDPADEAEYRTALYTNALKIADKRTDQELTPEKFEARVEGIGSEDVADWLGGGEWDAALRTAGVR